MIKQALIMFGVTCGVLALLWVLTTSRSEHCISVDLDSDPLSLDFFIGRLVRTRTIVSASDRIYPGDLSACGNSQPILLDGSAIQDCEPRNQYLQCPLIQGIK